MKTTIELSDEKFKEIYSNEDFRNSVAFACNCVDVNGKHLSYNAYYYPIDYIVSEEQIKKATEERERARQEKIENIKAGDLVFASMASIYEERFPEDVCHSRIRTEFKNKAGHHYFVEIIRSEGNYFYFEFSKDRDLENDYDKKLSEAQKEISKYKYNSSQWIKCRKNISKYLEQPYNNAFGLELRIIKLDYTLNNVLKVINETFDCDYKTICVDKYTLRCEDFICYC